MTDNASTDDPETDTPGTDTPGTANPETGSPETDTPETDTPETGSAGTDNTVNNIRSINAITLRTAYMAASVEFYVALGFQLSFGGEDAPFSTLRSGDCFVNLIGVASATEVETGWGRVIFHVTDVDALYQRALDAGLAPQHEPTDAPWGERMFAIFDPAGHDLSFAKRIRAYDVDHPDL